MEYYATVNLNKWQLSTTWMSLKFWLSKNKSKAAICSFTPLQSSKTTKQNYIHIFTYIYKCLHCICALHLYTYIELHHKYYFSSINNIFPLFVYICVHRLYQSESLYMWRIYIIFYDSIIMFQFSLFAKPVYKCVYNVCVHVWLTLYNKILR